MPSESVRSFLLLRDRKSEASLPTAREMLFPLDLENVAPVGVRGSHGRLSLELVSLELVSWIWMLVNDGFGTIDLLLRVEATEHAEDAEDSWVLDAVRLGTVDGAGLGWR